MLAETQRQAMLAAMGIEVYRLRGAAQAAIARIFLDAREVVQVACARDLHEDKAVARLFTLLPAALGIADVRVHWCADDTPPAEAIDVDAAAVHGNSESKRALWQALKPLAQRLHRSI